jgi:orotate phosphoribosyltransferase
MDTVQRRERLIDIVIERSFKYRDNPPHYPGIGKTSNYYFNCKPTTSTRWMNLIGELVFAMLADAEVTARAA